MKTKQTPRVERSFKTEPKPARYEVPEVSRAERLCALVRKHHGLEVDNLLWQIDAEDGMFSAIDACH